MSTIDPDGPDARYQQTIATLIDQLSFRGHTAKEWADKEGWVRESLYRLERQEKRIRNLHHPVDDGTGIFCAECSQGRRIQKGLPTPGWDVDYPCPTNKLLDSDV